MDYLEMKKLRFKPALDGGTWANRNITPAASKIQDGKKVQMKTRCTSLSAEERNFFCVGDEPRVHKPKMALAPSLLGDKFTERRCTHTE
jgi:hypothetical protein